MDERRQWFLSGFSRDSKILELGPGSAPIAAKYDGWNTQVLDHTSKEGLVRKLGLSHEEAARVDEVDVIYDPNLPLHELFGAEQYGTFDLIIASHVAEHIPDLIGFVNSCAALLNADGEVRLAMPDKRRCFDFFRPVTTTADLIAAHDRSFQTHTPATAFDAISAAINLDRRASWALTDYTNPTLVHSLQQAIACYDRSTLTNEYWDFHAGKFTPAAFHLVVIELHALAKISLSLKGEPESCGSEFRVSLKEGDRVDEGKLSRKRLALMEDVILEVGEQVEAIRKSRSKN